MLTKLNEGRRSAYLALYRAVNGRCITLEVPDVHARSEIEKEQARLATQTHALGRKIPVSLETRTPAHCHLASYGHKVDIDPDEDSNRIQPNSPPTRVNIHVDFSE